MHRRAKSIGDNKDALKAEYSIVLRALEVANLAFRRVVNIDEIAEALLPDEAKRLRKTYLRDPRHTISYILTRLTPSGLVFSPGKIHIYRYYGSAGVLEPKDSSLPPILSRRQRVLKLVRELVSVLGRAVRMGDILEYAPEKLELSDSSISRSVLSLVETGDLRVIDSIRGDSKGVNLYLPKELDPTLFNPDKPLTWMQEIILAFQELWNERAQASSATNRKPKPISTGEIRARIKLSSPEHPHLKSPYDLINSLQQLARSDKPLLRKVRRLGQRSVLWAPAGLSDKQLDINDVYASDTERVGEAVQRAEDRLKRPVNIKDIKEEISLDPSLQTTGTSKLYEVLADVSKERVDAGAGKGRMKRAIQRIHKIGKLDGDAYYSVSNVPEAQYFMRVRQLESLWLASSYEEDLSNLETCSLPSVAIGRARLIVVGAETFHKEIKALLKSKNLMGHNRHKAEELFERANDVLVNAKLWLVPKFMNQTELPEGIDTSVPGWTAQELLNILKPLYPQAQNITRPGKLVSLMFGSIRRIPNPKFKSRFSNSPHLAAEFLYDRTDALLYAAKQWGGYECCLQATLASNELGRLRDPRFVVVDLESGSFEARLACVACLAFLWSDEGNKRLRDIAVKDSDPGVRQSALWAYIFAGGEKSLELLRKQAKNDPHARVQVFAKEILSASQDSLWKI